MSGRIELTMEAVEIALAAWLVALAGCAGDAQTKSSEPAALPAPGYHVIKKLQLGGEGRWDYLTIDSENRRLYISRSTHVMVVDLDTEKIVGDIPDTQGVHGIAIAPELNRGYTSNGQANTSSIFDLKTLSVVGTVKTGENPDAIVYDPASKRVFTFNGRSQDATAFDGASGAVAGTIPLGGKPEFAAADGKGRLYVNIEDTSEVAEIDGAKLLVTRRFSLAPCEEPTGLALDAEHHLIFSGCHKVTVSLKDESGGVIGKQSADVAFMTVLNATKGELTATVPIGKGVDGNGFDPGLGLAFSANGEGTLTVAREAADGRFEVAETVPTEKGARTMAIDLKTHRIYLPTAQFAPATAATTDNPRPRPAMIKDSFVVLVVGK